MLLLSTDKPLNSLHIATNCIIIPTMTNPCLEFLLVSTNTWRTSKCNLQPNSIQPKHEQVFHKIISAEIFLTENVFLNAHLHNNDMKHTPIKRNQLLTVQQLLVVYCDMVSRLYISWFTCYRFSSIFSWKCNGSGNRHRGSACSVLWSSWHSLCSPHRRDNFSLWWWRQNSSCLFGQVVEYIFFKDSVILSCPNNFTQFNLKST